MERKQFSALIEFMANSTDDVWANFNNFAGVEINALLVCWQKFQVEKLLMQEQGENKMVRTDNKNNTNNTTTAARVNIDIINQNTLGEKEVENILQADEIALVEEIQKSQSSTIITEIVPVSEPTSPLKNSDPTNQVTASNNSSSQEDLTDKLTNSSAKKENAELSEVLKETKYSSAGTDNNKTETEQTKDSIRAQAPSPKKPLVSSQPILLPNGTVGKPYKFNVLKLCSSSSGIVELHVEGLESTGLHFEADTWILEGIPEKPGDFSPSILYRSKRQNDPSSFAKSTLSLTINADPKSLWKDLPSDKTDPYWKPDSDSKVLLQKRLLIAASQRGRSHAHEGKFRDDDFGLDYLNDGWYLATVADGAGSSKFSRKGSKIVCSCVLDYLKQNMGVAFDTDFEINLTKYSCNKENITIKKTIQDKVYTLLAGAAHAAFKKIQEEASIQSVPLKDYATTLIVSVMRQYEFGWFVGAYWVGDGGIGIYSRDSDVRLLGEPDGGEFAGQTRFITMPEVWEASEIYKRVRFEVIDDFTAVILMTDGITDAKFESENNLKNIEKWDILWDDLTRTVPLAQRDGSHEKELLQWLNFWSPGNHDDRTIAILV